MIIKSNVVELAAFKGGSAFSNNGKIDQKIASETLTSESGKALETMGVQAFPTTPAHQGSEEPLKAGLQKQKKPKPKAGKAKKGKIEVPGPLGHLHDADALDATALRLRYYLTYSSWKNRKSECKKKGGKWLYPEDFAGFLKVAGPRLREERTLDRLNNANPDYGPGLSEWRDKFAQNNNKGDNIAIPDPATGEIWTSHKLAKKHKVKVETIYHWGAEGRTDLEMIVGRKDPTLAKLDEILKKRGLAAPPKGVKIPEKKVEIAAIPKPDDRGYWKELDLAFADEHEDEYPEVFQQLVAERKKRRKAEYDDLVARAKRYNAGLPLPPKPDREFYTALPSWVATPPTPLPTARALLL